MVDNLLSWLAQTVEFPVSRGIAIGRVQNRMIEKWISVAHTSFLSFACLVSHQED
jgi:hypothetical protein